MFLARVLVGRSCLGRPDMQRPPPVYHDNPAVLYDSAVNSMYTPTIYVTFENDQAFPAYIITYRDQYYAPFGDHPWGVNNWGGNPF